MPPRENLVNKKFGRLIVLKAVEHRNRKCTWLCRCRCGNTKIATANSLKTGKVKSCGCLRIELGREKSRINAEKARKVSLVNQRFGRLLVLGESTINLVTKTRRWACKCDCGTTKIVDQKYLKESVVPSCGCYAIERLEETRIKKPLGMANAKKIIRNYRKSAMLKGLPIEFTDEELLELLSKDCHYCGESPANVCNEPRSNGAFYYNGIDRVNNDLGYLKTNCVPCCRTCNRAKLQMTLEEFTSWISRAYHHLNKGYRSLTWE